MSHIRAPLYQMLPGIPQDARSERLKRDGRLEALARFVCSMPARLRICPRDSDTSALDNSIIVTGTESHLEELGKDLRVNVTFEDQEVFDRHVKIRIEAEGGLTAAPLIDDIGDAVRDISASLSRTPSVALEVSRCQGGVQFRLSMDLSRDSLGEIRRFLEQVDTVSGVQAVDASAQNEKLC